MRSKRRVGGTSQQRLTPEESEVILVINAGMAQIRDVCVMVDRTKESNHRPSEHDMEPVELEKKVTQTNNGKYRLHVNLDSVYETKDGKRVYELVKNNTKETNRFHLIIKLQFIDGSWSNDFQTISFKIIGKPPKNNQNGQSTHNGSPGYLLQDPPPGGKKRKISDSNETILTLPPDDIPALQLFNIPDQLYLQPGSNVSSHTNESSGYTTADSLSPTRPRNDSFISASKVAADRIEAQVAEIGELIIANPIQTRRGDIAYHFVLKDPNAHPEFKEGEIIGFFADKQRGRVLDKLTRENSPDALLRGIVTRSAYIEAKKMPDHVRTETICMFGIVPVKVKGTVNENDQLYASVSDPGVAVSEFNLRFKPSLANDSALIGVAWEAKKPGNEDEVNLVQSFVSIQMENCQNMMKKSVAAIDHEIHAIKKDRKAGKRCRWICLAFTAIFLALLATLLYQVFMPGSAFRYWRCRQGSIRGYTATFTYVSRWNVYTPGHVKGIRFEWSNLKQKLDLETSNYRINGTGFYYYLNIDRCAYGELRRTEDKALGLKQVSGPTMFATNEACNLVFYYHDTFQRWCRYRSAKEIICLPMRQGNVTLNEPGYCKPLG